MIRATIAETRIEVAGHAPREPGAKENLTCAAVSALVQTARDAMREIGGVELTRSEERSGYILAEWEDVTFIGHVLLQNLLLGLRNLAEPGVMEVTSLL